MHRRSRRQSVPSRQGPSLLGTMARTAAISSTATATSRAVNQAIDQKATKPQQEPAAQPELLAQLTQLTQLKEAGALTEEEFKLAKAKLLIY